MEWSLGFEMTQDHEKSLATIIRVCVVIWLPMCYVRDRGRGSSWRECTYGKCVGGGEAVKSTSWSCGGP